MPPDKTPEISVIVRIYNSEKSLCNTLESICAQSFSAFECILVDDGSTDGSPALCDDYAAKDSRFRVIHQQNMGCGMARITGLDGCRADKILFCDSDDFLEPDALSVLQTAQSKNGAKLVLGAVKCEAMNSRFSIIEWRIPQPEENMADYIMDYGAPHGILFSKCLSAGISPPANGMGEDSFFLIQLFSKAAAKETCVVNDIVYRYTVMSETSECLRFLHEFSAPSMLNSNYGNYEKIFDILESGGSAALAKYIQNKNWGYLHMASVYLLLNKTRPQKKEIQKLYGIYKMYGGAWRGAFYEKAVIPLYHKAFFICRIYRRFVCAANNLRLLIQKYKRRFYGKTLLF
ncbi:MAG: glycosyltransferase family 2 protein [Spirochaetaceae bacterium]|jgi:glycosyltransferase involved in cell wall biosynthesis|nr:glycosyltransferase family 2 protein [Spirochaetaceae bacterium]